MNRFWWNFLEWWGVTQGWTEMLVAMWITMQIHDFLKDRAHYIKSVRQVAALISAEVFVVCQRFWLILLHNKVSKLQFIHTLTATLSKNSKNSKNSSKNSKNHKKVKGDVILSTLTFRQRDGGWCHQSLSNSLRVAVNVCINCSFDTLLCSNINQKRWHRHTTNTSAEIRTATWRTDLI